MLVFLQDMDAAGELRAIPVWKAHQLTADRKGTWSLHVTRNWRLTFRVDGKEIVDIDFEDYHYKRRRIMRMLNPPHPGDFVRTEVIEPLGLSVAAAARVLGVSRPTLSTFLNSHSGLSASMALRIEKAFGVKMDTLMRMQASYDIARARTREADIAVRRYRPAATTL